MRGSSTRGRPSSRSIACAGLLLLTCAHLERPAEPGLLLHATFDGTVDARSSRGTVGPTLTEGAGGRSTTTFVKAVFGQGVSVLPRSYDALGTVQPERGTIAFFYRPASARSTNDPLQVRTVDAYYWKTYLRLSYRRRQLAVWIADERLEVQETPARGARLTDEWQHVAVAWDQAYGAVLYLDGREVASSWGRQSWTSRGVDPAELLLSGGGGSAYDELWVFDRALDAPQIARLARENRPPGAAGLPELRFGARERANRLQELSWQEPDATTPRLRRGRPTAIRQVAVMDARAQKKEMGAVFDGKLGEGWPASFSYEFAGGGGLSVEAAEPYDLLSVEGAFRGDVWAGRHLARPRKGVQVASFGAGAYRRYARVPSDTPRWISFFDDDGRRSVRGWVTEIGLFRSGVAELADSTPRVYWLGPELDPPASGLGRELEGRFGAGDRTVGGLAEDRMPRAAEGFVPALRFHHLVVPPASRDRGVVGLRLRLWTSGAERENRMRIEVRDPELPGRRLASLDFTLEPGDASQPLDVTLDLRDRVVPAGRPLWIQLVFERDVALVLGGERASRLDVHESSVVRARPEYVVDELLFGRSRFRALSGSRPWASLARPETALARRDPRARELLVPLVRLRAHAPDDPRVRALWAWTHKRDRDVAAVRPEPVPGHDSAPRWARLQREIQRTSRQILHWWIDHRQVANGEFGDDWSDDTDLLQNFPALVLLGDPDGRLRDAARCTANGVYGARMSRGINARAADPLHAYEEGVNAQSAMAMIDWGDPRYLERLMETSETGATRLTKRDVKGRRRFVTSRFGARQPVAPGFDSPDNALMFHPALLLGYYGRVPRAIDLTKEWIDGWLDYYVEAERSAHRPPGRPYPSRTRLDGTVLAWDTKARGHGYVSLYAALDAMTEDPRYRNAARYWTGEYAPRGFMRGNSSNLPALELIDRSRFRAELLNWADAADVSRPYVDGFGRVARQRYVRWEVAGDEAAALASLEATLRNLRTLFPAYTWAEPVADRIWLPLEGLQAMMQGDVSYARNQLWPRHYTSYSGFSDLTAWVREKSGDTLRVWLYSFAPVTERGVVRVWRTPPGPYTVRVGGRSFRAELHRAAQIAVELPPGRIVELSVERAGRTDASYWSRPDLAVSIELPGPARPGVNVVVHNLGREPARRVRVLVLRADGRVLGERTIGTLAGVDGFDPGRRVLEFPRVRPRPGLVVVVDPDDRIAELEETNNRVRVQRDGCSSPTGTLVSVSATD